MIRDVVCSGRKEIPFTQHTPIMMTTRRPVLFISLAGLVLFFSLLLPGCGKHRPPSSFEIEPPPQPPHVPSQVSLFISMPGILMSSSSIWNYRRHNYDNEHAIDTTRYALEFATGECPVVFSGDTVRFQCGGRRPQIEWECFILLDSTRQRIDSLFVGNKGHYVPLSNRRGYTDESSYAVVKGLPYAFAGDTLVAVITGGKVGGVLEKMGYRYQSVEYLSNGEPPGTFQRSLQLLPPDEKSVISIRIW